jgi:glutamate formiminotransferase
LAGTLSPRRPHQGRRRPGAPYACAVSLPLESVPNFSEGRDAAVVDALRDALARPARLLDVHVDPDHHRSVYTLVGSGEELVESLFSGIRVAVDQIDLRAHAGAHPRIGAADVVPLVPIRPEDEPIARDAALALADRLGDELELPVFFYGRLTEDGREPAFFRRGGPEELQRRVDAGELAPDRGPPRLHPTAGGVVLGVRRPLIAFNVNLRSQDVECAKAIAGIVRERDGGFPGVRALGLDLPTAGLVQVSMNVTEWEAAALHEIVERINAEAASRGVEVAGSELVGLMPAGAAVAAAGSILRIDGFDARHVLELRLLED